MENEIGWMKRLRLGTSRRAALREWRCEMMCDVMKNNVEHQRVIPENHLTGECCRRLSRLQRAAQIEGEQRRT